MLSDKLGRDKHCFDKSLVRIYQEPTSDLPHGKPRLYRFGHRVLCECVCVRVWLGYVYIYVWCLTFAVWPCPVLSVPSVLYALCALYALCSMCSMCPLCQTVSTVAQIER